MDDHWWIGNGEDPFLDDHCSWCGQRIEIMIFKGTHLCSVRCRKAATQEMEKRALARQAQDLLSQAVDHIEAAEREAWDCGSGYCDPNTGCPACSDPPAGGWHRHA